MATNTDTSWNARLAAVMPANFMNNISENFSAGNNTILSTMMNMIGRTVVDGVDVPSNPFATYTKPMMDYGDVIQSYKVPYSAAGKYNPEDTDPFNIVKNAPKSLYFTANDNSQYQATIYDREFRKAFNSENNFNAFVSAQLDSMVQSDVLDKRTKWKKYLSQDNIGAEVTVTKGSNYASDLLDTLKDYANNKLREPSVDYNALGDTAISNSVDIIMRRQDKLAIDKTLYGVYNLNLAGVDANIKLVDDFATPADTGRANQDLVAIICDSRALEYTPIQATTTSQYNGKGLYTNYFYTVEGVYGIAKYRNLVQVFATGA